MIERMHRVLGLLLILATGCTSAANEPDSGPFSDVGPDPMLRECLDAGSRCGIDAAFHCEIDARRACITSAASCILLHACYMGPSPDAGSPDGGAEEAARRGRCEVACDRCDLECGVLCDAPSACLESPRSCEAIAACAE